MSVKAKKEDIYLCAQKILKKQKIEDVTMESVPPTDKRAKFQLNLHDEITKNNFALMADTVDDVTSLMPELLKNFIRLRKGNV